MGIEEALRLHREEIIQEWVIRLHRDVGGPYSARPREDLLATVSEATDAYFAVLVNKDFSGIDAFIEKIAKMRSGAGFLLSDVQKAFELYRSILVPILMRELGCSVAMEPLQNLNSCLGYTNYRFSEFFQALHEKQITSYAQNLEAQIESRTRELRESENKFRDFAEKASVGVYLIQDGVFKYVNARFAEIYGYTVEEIIDRKSPKDLVLPDDVPMVEENIRKRMSGEMESLRYEFRGLTKQGDVTDAEIYGSRATYQGRPAVIGTLLDVTERKKAREALKRSEEKYRELVENANSIILRRNLTGDITFFNEFAQHFFGYTEEEILGRNEVGTIVPPLESTGRDLKALIEDIGQNPDGYINNVNENMRRNGERVWIAWTNRPVYNHRAEVVEILCIGNDITERKRGEENLRAAHRQLLDIIEFLPDATFIIDKDKKIIAWNRAMEEMTGIPKNDIIGKDHYEAAIPFYGKARPFLMDLVDKDDKELASQYDDVKRRGNVLYAETFVPTLYDGAGAYVWSTATPLYDRNGALTGIIESIRDVTERRQAEDGLKKGAALLRSVVSASPIGIAVNTGERVIVWVNEGMVSITGYTQEELQGRPARLLYPTDEEFTRVGEVVYGEVGRGRIGTIETMFMRKDGQVRDVQLSVAAIDPMDTSAGLVFTITDITEGKRAREERTKLESQLRQSQKMEAIGTLAGGIAHDLNNILTVLVGCGSILQMELSEDNPLRTYVNQMLSSSERAADLTRSLLAFSRKQPIRLGFLQLNDHIKKTGKLLKRLVTEDIELKTRLTHDDTTIMADETQVDQILFNLATNARDAMPKGGTLSVETKVLNVDRASLLMHGVIEEGTYVVLSVSDTGTGMDEKTKEKIFDPFFTTKEVGKGTGLGLSTVYGIVGQHNGHINVWSELGRGTTFHIYFPLVRVMAEEGKVAASLPKGGTETILVAEDNDDVRGFVREILKRFGYTVIEASDGDDAIAKFTQHATVDLLLLDSVMPKKNGREVYDEIRKINPRIKALFASGYARDVVLEKGIQEKEFDFIAKPVSPGDLLEKVREVLDK